MLVAPTTFLVVLHCLGITPRTLACLYFLLMFGFLLVLVLRTFGKCTRLNAKFYDRSEEWDGVGSAVIQSQLCAQGKTAKHHYTHDYTISLFLK